VTDEELRHYSDALDEIYRLRSILAYESRVTDAHHESYKTFPKTRKKFAVEQAERMRAAARGETLKAYNVIAYPHENLRSVGAKVTLTRHQWETRND